MPSSSLLSLSSSPHFLPSSPHPCTKTLKPLLLCPTMKDRPPSSYGSVYIPPHHRLRSVISSSNNNASKTGADFSTSASVIQPKLIDRKNAPVLSARDTAAAAPPPSPSPFLQQPQQQQQQRTYNSNNSSKNSNNNNSQYNSAYDDGISEDGSDRELNLSLESVSSYVYYYYYYEFEYIEVFVCLLG